MIWIRATCTALLPLFCIIRLQYYKIKKMQNYLSIINIVKNKIHFFILTMHLLTNKYIFENLIDTNKLFNDINLIPSWTSLKHIIFINKFEKCLGKKLTSNEISNFKLISDFDNLIKNLKD